MSDFEDGNDSSKMDHEGGDKESQNSQSNGDKKEEPIKDIDPEVKEAEIKEIVDLP